MPDQYSIIISITLEANDTKKNAIRDDLVNRLTQARAAGTIISATINVTRITVPETVTFAPL